MKKNKTKNVSKIQIGEVKPTSRDYDISTLMNYEQQGTLVIPSFQREEVYNVEKKSKLVESILIGIPIPTIFLYQDDEEKLNVIDGQQRLRSFIDFLNNKFALKKLEFLGDLNGKKFKQLDKNLQTKYKLSTLHCVQINKENNDLKFEIFSRLNQGTPLNEQELRNCIYHGSFNDMLENIAHNNKDIIKLVKKENKRKLYQELILRFFAITDISHYKSSLKNTLNDYMSHHQELSDKEIKNCKKKYNDTLKLIKETLGESAFEYTTKKGTTKWSVNIYDCIMVAFSAVTKHDIIMHKNSIRKQIEKLKNSKKFLSTLEKNTNHITSVQFRITSIYQILSKYMKSDSSNSKRFFSQSDKKKLWHKGYKCNYCGQEILSIDDAEVDHTIPYSKGGLTNLKNAQLLHMLCNRIKSNSESKTLV